MSKYSDILGSVSPSALGVRRAADVVAALSPPARSDTEIAKNSDAPSTSSAVLALVPGAIGAGFGALAWKRHRVLGAVVGHALATTALPLVRGGADRRRALCQLGVEGAAVAGSLLYDKHPILGFVGGLAVGAAATAFVPGSPVNTLWKKWRSGK